MTTLPSDFETTRAVAYDAYLSDRKAEAYALLCEHLTLTQCEKDFAAVYKRSLPAREPLVGDILVRSWGWEQTNIDYYQVVGVTSASVKIRKILKTQVADHETTVDVVPLKDRFETNFDGTPMKTWTKRFKTDAYDSQSYGCKIDSYSSARLWDGTPDSETGAGYGH